MSKKIVVIGLGNILRRDDGIGIAVLAALLDSYKREGIDYLDFGIAGFDLLNKIPDYDIVLLIDGINASLRHGELIIFGLDEIEHTLKDQSIISSHEMGLREIFELSKTLDIKTRIYIAGIQTEDISYKEELSERLENRLGGVTREISVFVDKIARE